MTTNDLIKKYNLDPKRVEAAKQYTLKHLRDYRRDEWRWRRETLLHWLLPFVFPVPRPVMRW